jgi:hypothetical protein
MSSNVNESRKQALYETIESTYADENNINIRAYKYHQTSLSNYCNQDWASPDILEAGELGLRL